MKKSGKQIINYIRSYGLTIKEIAEATGLSEGGVKKIANGQRKGSEATLRKLEQLHKDIKELKNIKSIKERKAKKKANKKIKQKVMFKNTSFDICLDKLFHYKDTMSICLFVEVIANEFVQKSTKIIEKCKNEKFIYWGKLYLVNGDEVPCTLTRYFFKHEFKRAVKSFELEITNTLCTVISALSGSKKEISAIRIVLLGYEKKKKTKKKRKN